MGSAAAARPRGLEVGILNAVQQAHLTEAGLRFGVLRVLRERLLVRRDGPRVVAGLDGVVRLGVQRRQRRLGGLLVGLLGRLNVEPAGHAVLRGELQQLREHLAHLLLGNRAGEQRHRLPAEERDHHRDGLGAESLRKLRVGVDVDLRQDEPAVELRDDLLEDGAELLARPAPLRPEVDDDRDGARQFEHLPEGLIGDVHHERRDAAHGRAVFGGRGGCSGCGGTVAQCERSTAPRRTAPGAGSVT